MNYKIICRIISQILAIEAALMLPAVIIGVCDGTMQSVLAFLVTIAATLVFSGVLSIFSRRAKKGFYAREGLVCVGLGWTLMSIFGCLPFVISGEIPSFINALFETVSGFTTTGSSILENVELLSRCMLYWRRQRRLFNSSSPRGKPRTRRQQTHAEAQKNRNRALFHICLADGNKLCRASDSKNAVV